MGRVLLVQPRFPIPNKSHNHKDYLPIGLLKLGAWRRQLGDDVALSLGDLRTDFQADEVLVTSLFTYWASQVREAVQFYRQLLPKAAITVGGVYASLQPTQCKDFTGCDYVWQGVHEEAERCDPDYSLVETDFQILHASRGCIRRCAFCGTHKIEPEFRPKETVEAEIVRNHVVFYDNNLLANPYLENILGEVSAKRVEKRPITCESQSGLDGRILLKKPRLARALKEARFRNPRIAWDGRHRDWERIEKQLVILREAGFSPKDTQVFILYNHRLSPEEVRAKVDQCFRWGVQVADCRFRPLNLVEDGYKPQRKSQEPGEYYLHKGWADSDVRGIRRLVRENNICVRYRIPRERYNQRLEGLSCWEKQSIARRLGFTGPRYTAAELDAINEFWLAGHDPADSFESPQ